jgi:hypothetical protein
MTIHHILPKSEGGTIDDTMRMCKTCHSFLHYCIPLDEIHEYDDINKLELHPKYRLYIEWIRKVTHTSMIKVKKLKQLV